MAKIFREPAAAASRKYDLIIIGGGIYGAMLSLESSRRGLKSLLLERADFGGATSFNSLRILHGGLRYLQKLDLRRFWESVNERRWFLQTFPNLVEPLPCLMPLYGKGFKHPAILRMALSANDLLSWKRNQRVHPDRYLPAGKLISDEKTEAAFPAVEMEGLKGSAVWHDAFITDSQRLLIEILRWSCEYGATALNYMEAIQLLKINENVAGIAALDFESGKSYEFKSKIVINASGPWCRSLAASFDKDEPKLFRSSIAWNILLNTKPLSNHALAVMHRGNSRAQVYFLLPWKGKILAGTGHAPWHGSQDEPIPSVENLNGFLANLNLAVPALQVSQNDIFYVFAGLLPVTKTGSVNLATREVIINHADQGGPRGLFSISGVKFTTSRLVAEKTLNLIFPGRIIRDYLTSKEFAAPIAKKGRQGILDSDGHLISATAELRDRLKLLVKEEAVQHLDDLVFRRTSLWNIPQKALQIAPQICDFFDWDSHRRFEELEKLKDMLPFLQRFENTRINTRKVPLFTKL